MSEFIISDETFYKNIIDAMPSAVFIMDDQTRVVDCNKAAAKISRGVTTSSKFKLCGDVIRCTHALREAEGCGNTKYCKDCGIRTSIDLAFKKQEKVLRQKATMHIEGSNGPIATNFLITTSVVTVSDKRLMVVSLEDISEIVQLSGILTTCSSCKKIRDPEGKWHNMDVYIEKSSDIRFSHGLCSDCAQKLYPDLQIYKSKPN